MNENIKSELFERKSRTARITINAVSASVDLADDFPPLETPPPEVYELRRLCRKVNFETFA